MRRLQFPSICIETVRVRGDPDRKDKNIFFICRTNVRLCFEQYFDRNSLFIVSPAGGWKKPVNDISACYILYIPNDGRLFAAEHQNRHGKLFRIGIYIDTWIYGRALWRTGEFVCPSLHLIRNFPGAQYRIYQTNLYDDNVPQA